VDGHTLAHELAHVIQQRQGPVAGTDPGTGLRISDPRDSFEREAEATADRVMAPPSAGRALSVAPTPRFTTARAPSLQRKPVNEAFTKAVADVDDVTITEEGYFGSVDASVNERTPIAFIVNVIFSYHEVEQIPDFVASILDGFSGAGNRVGLILGMNAHSSKRAELNVARKRARKLIAGYDVPIAMVHSVYTTKKFPFGKMRNAVLHSPECLKLSRAFAAKQMHPYISTQDFDAGSRKTPSGAHAFDDFERLLNGPDPDPDDSEAGPSSSSSASSSSSSWSSSSSSADSSSAPSSSRAPAAMEIEGVPVVERPLMMAGGYRVTASADELIAAIRARFVKAHPGAPLPDALAERMPSEPESAEMDEQERKRWTEAAEKRETFLRKFKAYVLEDLGARKALAAIHPLLPYAPEPNLYFDALPNLLGRGKASAPDGESFPLSFGEGAAEFTQLAMQINELNAWELYRRFAAAYDSAPKDIPVKPVHEETDRPENLDEDTDMAPEFAPETEETLDLDQTEILSSVQAHAENNVLPVRGRAVITDFVDGSVVTDLSRLGLKQFVSGSLPQGHQGLTIVTDRFFSASKPPAASAEKVAPRPKGGGKAKRKRGAKGKQKAEPYNPKSAKKGVGLGGYRKRYRPGTTAALHS
jgi:hypothetical protein